MAWKMIEGPTAKWVNKKMAREWAALKSAQGDRPPDIRRLATYRTALNCGRLRDVAWSKVICKETGEVVRTNGRHTCYLAADPATDLNRTPMQTVITVFECDTRADVSDLYSTYDAKYSMRNHLDNYQTVAHNTEGMEDFTRKNIGFLVSGLFFYVTTFKCEPPELVKQLRGNGEEYTDLVARASLLSHYSDFAIWANDILSGSNAKHIQRMPVVAAMAATFEVAPKAATQFWVEVRDQSGPNNTDMSRVLEQFLTTKSLHTGVSRRTLGFEIKTPREFLARCITAWNHWRNGTKSKKIPYFVNSPVPDPV